MTTVEIVKNGNGNKTAFDAPSFKGWKMLPEELVIIGLDTKDGPEHPLYDERVAGPYAIKMDSPEMEQRISNIMRHGIIRGVAIVREGDKAIVVDGRQTVRAAREANKRFKKAGQPPVLVLCMPPSQGDEKEQIGRMLAGNTSISDPPMARAAKVARLLNRGMEAAEIGQEMGLSHQSVRNIASLLQLTTKLQELVNTGGLNESIGYELAKLPKNEQEAEYERLKAEGHLTVQAAQIAVRNLRTPLDNEGEGEGAEATGTGEGGAEKTRKPREPKPVDKAHVARFPPPKTREMQRLAYAIEKGVITDKMVKGGEYALNVIRWAAGKISMKAVEGLSDAHAVADAWFAEQKEKKAKAKAAKAEKKAAGGEKRAAKKGAKKGRSKKSS